MKRIFFSIIIPTFNSESTINRCLNSILNQKFQDFEIVIVDSLSSDSTTLLVRQLTKQIADKVIIISEKDKCVYDAMNKGIEISNGKWLYFLGSDDFLYDNNVLLCVHDKISIFDTIVYGNVKLVGNVSWGSGNLFYDGQFSDKKFSQKNICHQSLFYRRDIIIKYSIKFNLKYKICSDWEFNMKLWKTNYFRYLDLVIAVFNAGGISSSNKVDEEFSKDYSNLLKLYFNKKLIIYYPKIFQKLFFFFQSSL